MRLNEYETTARREIEAWQRERSPLPYQLMAWAMMPLEWLADNVVPPEMLDQVNDGVASVLSMLNDASEWTYAADGVLSKAQARGLDATTVSELRDAPLDTLDDIARGHFKQNTIMAAVGGGGTGLGGIALIAADIPILFTINFRLIQQIGACYGLSVRGDEYYPLVLSVFNVAASDSAHAKSDALREVSVAAAAFAHDAEYRGRQMSGTLREQNRQLPREIAKNLVGKKLGQLIPVAGAVVGAGVNYWFTAQTARAAFMLFRAIYIERKERL